MITVKLTSQEAAAHDLAGNASDEDVKGVLHLQLVTRGVIEPRATVSAHELAKAALSARQKIAAATAYTIEVSDDE